MEVRRFHVRLANGVLGLIFFASVFGVVRPLVWSKPGPKLPEAPDLGPRQASLPQQPSRDYYDPITKNDLFKDKSERKVVDTGPKPDDPPPQWTLLATSNQSGKWIADIQVGAKVPPPPPGRASIVKVSAGQVVTEGKGTVEIVEVRKEYVKYIWKPENGGPKVIELKPPEMEIFKGASSGQ